MHELDCLLFWIVSVSLITFLLWRGLVKSVAFTTLFVAICAFAFVLLAFERVAKVNIQGNEVTLNEVNKVKQEVFAKAETVRRLAELSAELAAQNVHFARPLTIGELGMPQMSEEEMLKTRDKILSVLKETGSDTSTLQRVASQINHVVLESLKLNLYLEIMKLANGNKEVINHCHDLIFGDYRRLTLVDYLRKGNLCSDTLIPTLDRIDALVNADD